MNLRMTVLAATAVFLSAISLTSVVKGNVWIGAGFAAVVVVAAAGLCTRLSATTAAVIATVGVLLASIPLLAYPNWDLRVLGIVLVLLTAASATGRRPLRAFATLAAYLAWLLIYLNLLFASQAASIGGAPSDHSMRVLGNLVSQAFGSFKYSPPVPDTHAVSLVAAAGIGLAAIAVDLLAVRFRRPAVAGLPLLVLFSVPIASNLKTFGFIQIVTFAAALAGYLALLSSDGRNRLRLWGQLVTFRYVQAPNEPGSGPDTSELAASGRRIGLAAACLAIVIPIILPATHVDHLFGTTSNGNGQGNGGGEFSDLLAVHNELIQKPVPVLTYSTTAANPAQQYLQLYVLNYSARLDTWVPQLAPGRVAPAQARLPFRAAGVSGATPVTTVHTTITMSKDQSGPSVLPAPYAPVQLRVPTNGWDEAPGSLMLSSTVATTSNLTYTVVSKVADPAAGQISSVELAPADIQSEYGSYNGPDSAQLLSIAQKHTSGAVTALQEADDLQDWLTSSAFKYTLKPNLPSSHWLLKFLTTDQRGYCIQFAWAFAALARELALPTRIAIGYTGGLATGKAGRYQVTTADAHAWPEVYFPGDGWLRFEPTPSGDHGQGTATSPSYSTGHASNSAPGGPSGSQQNPGGPTGSSSSGKKSTGHNRFQHLAGSGAATTGDVAGGTGPWLPVVIAIAVLLLLTWPALIRQITRRRRWLRVSGDASAAHAAWRELADDLTDYGVDGAPGETPRALTRRMTEALELDDPVAQALARIGAAEERARYAPAPSPGAGLRADGQVVRRAIAASVAGKQRWRARLLPQSTLIRAVRLAEQAGALLSWLDTSWPTLRRQARRLVTRRAD